MGNWKKMRAGAAALAIFVLCMAGAQAQPRREVREHERARFATPHWVFDDRFHHNHYYPAVGYAVDALPPGNIAVGFRGGNWWFHSGVWYQHVGPRYIVARPPLGVLVPVLPPAYSIVYYGGVPYYYANDVYYVQQPTGYEVVAPPPVGAAPAAPPVAAVPTAPTPGAQGPAVWYYCDSAKSYYPYVSQCAEGWKSVPATPPAGAPR